MIATWSAVWPMESLLSNCKDFAKKNYHVFFHFNSFVEKKTQKFQPTFVPGYSINNFIISSSPKMIIWIWSSVIATRCSTLNPVDKSTMALEQNSSNKTSNNYIIICSKILDFQWILLLTKPFVREQFVTSIGSWFVNIARRTLITKLNGSFTSTRSLRKLCDTELMLTGFFECFSEQFLLDYQGWNIPRMRAFCKADLSYFSL